MCLDTRIHRKPPKTGIVYKRFFRVPNGTVLRCIFQDYIALHLNTRTKDPRPRICLTLLTGGSYISGYHAYRDLRSARATKGYNEVIVKCRYWSPTVIGKQGGHVVIVARTIKPLKVIE